MPCLSSKYDPNKGLFISVAITPVGVIPSAASKAVAPKIPVAAPAAKQTITTFSALIDTGADTTCITQAVADAIGLKPVGKIPMTSSTHTTDVDAFLGDIAIPVGGNQVYHMPGVMLMKFQPNPNATFQVLLGRDVICKGTLTLSFDGHFTFCL
jgi:hypothetical protein